MTALLETRALSKSFGALRATRDVTFALEEGARHALIGPNGAGKTTFINLLTGVLAPSAGEVLFKGQDITQVEQAERVKLGIAAPSRSTGCSVASRCWRMSIWRSPSVSVPRQTW